MSEKSITEASQTAQVPLEAFRAAYDALFVLIAHVPPHLREASGACGEWSPKQILQHLSGWLVEAENRFKVYDENIHVAGIRYDFDTFNAASVSVRSTLGWDDTVEELRTQMHKVSQHAETAIQNNTELHRGYRGWLHALAEDCIKHTEQIRQFISREMA